MMARVPQHKKRKGSSGEGKELPEEPEYDHDVKTHTTRKPVMLPKIGWTDRPLPADKGSKK